MRSLLSFLLTASALGGSLRGVPEDARRLQNSIVPQNMEANELAFLVNFDMYPKENPGRPAEQAEYNYAKGAIHDWMTDLIEAVLLSGGGEFNLEKGTNTNGCKSNLIDGTWFGGMGMYRTMIRYVCTFRGVDAPVPPIFMTELLNAANDEAAQTALQEAVEGAAPGGSSFGVGGRPYIWGDLDKMTTTAEEVISWAAIGSNNRDNFDNAFVLPYVLTWSFTTPPNLAGQADFDACKDATKQWVENYWDSLYPNMPGAMFARRTVDVYLRYSEFSPGRSLYQQTVSLGVDILIGANNVTDVPSVAEYAATMQLVYRVSNFTSLLDDALPANATLNQSNRTAFAITPTYQVETLEASKFRHENQTINTNGLVAASSFSVVLGGSK